MLSLDEFYWHDGQLQDLAFAMTGPQGACLSLTVWCYPDERASTRERYRLECYALHRYICTLDVQQLTRQQRTGNIVQARFADDRLWLYFTEGLLEVQAGQFHLEALGDAASSR